MVNHPHRSRSHLYGAGNSGPAQEVWREGDHVIYAVRGVDYGQRGIVGSPRRDRNAGEPNYVWVDWYDGSAGYHDPNTLDLDRA